MGCDIHLHTEVKIGGVWLHYGCPDVNRNYCVFAKMAGVRNDAGYGITPIAAPRGLPKDVSELTAFACELYGEDGHSHSFLTSGEVECLYRFIDIHLKLTGKHNTTRWWGCENFGYFFEGFEGGEGLAGFVAGDALLHDCCSLGKRYSGLSPAE